MKPSENVRLGISIGDLNGIGSEIILKTFDDPRMLELCTPIIFASAKTVSVLKKLLNSELNFHGIDDASQALEGRLNVVNVWKDSPQIRFGEEDKRI